MSLYRANYEVDADFIELVTPDGYKQWLGRGAQVPEWVEPDVLKKLLAERAVIGFEVLRNG